MSAGNRPVWITFSPQSSPGRAGNARLAFPNAYSNPVARVRGMARKSYRVESFRIGNKEEGDQIIFASLEDMEQAYKDVDNGRDIYIEKDGVITKLLQPMLTSKIYDGRIVLSARVGGYDKSGDG
jgi:hypothetical protein